MVSLYLIGIAVGCIAALVLNRTAFKGDPVPFIMELPNYRLPSVKTTVMLAWDKPRTLLPSLYHYLCRYRGYLVPSDVRHSL